MGQYTRRGPVGAMQRICPLFKGGISRGCSAIKFWGGGKTPARSFQYSDPPRSHPRLDKDKPCLSQGVSQVNQPEVGAMSVKHCNRGNQYQSFVVTGRSGGRSGGDGVPLLHLLHRRHLLVLLLSLRVRIVCISSFTVQGHRFPAPFDSSARTEFPGVGATMRGTTRLPAGQTTAYACPRPRRPRLSSTSSSSRTSLTDSQQQHLAAINGSLHYQQPIRQFKCWLVL